MELDPIQRKALKMVLRYFDENTLNDNNLFYSFFKKSNFEFLVQYSYDVFGVNVDQNHLFDYMITSYLIAPFDSLNKANENTISFLRRDLNNMIIFKNFYDKNKEENDNTTFLKPLKKPILISKHKQLPLSSQIFHHANPYTTDQNRPFTLNNDDSINELGTIRTTEQQITFPNIRRLNFLFF